MTVEEIEKLIASCAAAGIGEIALSEAGLSLHLSMVPTGAVAIALVSEIKTASNAVRAPGVGIFRHAHPATGRPVAEAGDAVRKGDVVGLLQVGPRLKAALAPADGVLGPPLADDGALVGYGTPLYALL
jgi:acetyl-CoA carboxylase biotin carboxyl carrier protein